MLEPNVRFALIVAFLLGGVSIAASGVRHAIINHILRDRSSALENYSRRKTVEMWGVIELSSALLAFCLPLFRRHLVSVFGPGGVLSRRGGNSGSSKQKVQVLAAATVGGSAMSEGRKGSKGRAGIEIEDVELGRYLGITEGRAPKFGAEDWRSPTMKTACSSSLGIRSGASSQERLNKEITHLEQETHRHRANSTMV